ncbi:carbohydrate ABC transporter permease [Limnochorda pilosa]|uniref:ABC transporter permease n=1 Tax=Limnochorda pilosa TaxID=1555112 RepID=A0A0K2SGL4_LIMPI|nr:carbohydrate ABC transporter permease [Limnochorda pilosa]BAS26251.1 ABC transporter permease [Limnochorda pilosa]
MKLTSLTARGRNYRETMLLVVLIGLTSVFLLPLAWTVLTSLKLHKDIFTYPPKWVFQPTLENYAYVLQRSEYLKYMLNSAAVSLSSAGFSVLIGAMAAYAFTRFRIRASNHLLLWILSLRMIPPIAVVVPFYLMAIRSGLYDTRVGLAIVLLTVNLPIAVWLQLSYIREIPIELEEAAMVDGSSRLGAFLRIVLPLEAPGLFATFIMCLIFSWNEFPLSLILTSQQARTLPVSMLSWDTQRGLLWGYMMSASVMAVAPILLLTAVIQKYLVRGLTLGGVKE